MRAAGTKPELKDRLLDKFNLVEPAPVPANLLTAVAALRKVSRREALDKDLRAKQKLRKAAADQQGRARLCKGGKCNNNPYAQACPFQLCGSCCRGCPRHTRS